MREISITRGLAELKTLDSKIAKAIGYSKFIDAYQKRAGQVIHSCMKKDEFENKAKSDIQSIKDLMERKKEIKSKIMLSNAVTKVKIGKEEYTVAEAIVRKNDIDNERNLINTIRQQIVSIKNHMERAHEKLNNEITNMINSNLTSKDSKTDKNAYKNISDEFYEQNKLTIVDPCNLIKKVTEMENELDEFISEVDFCLSESNSRNTIEIKGE